jgi:plastocyanin
MRRIRSGGAALALAFVAMATLSGASKAETFVIEVNKLAFGPAPSGLHVDDVVEWRNLDIFRHSATAADGSFDVDLPAGGSGQTILNKAGVIEFRCRFHPGMKGRLDVAP